MRAKAMGFWNEMGGGDKRGAYLAWLFSAGV